MKMFGTFNEAISKIEDDLVHRAYHLDTKRWQSVDVSDKPEMKMKEILNTSFIVTVPHENLDRYREDIKPNLPWADDHFEERVGGRPLNPGVQWANWPWGHSANRFRTQEQFSHTYMERYWPKQAGEEGMPGASHAGIRYLYGDLFDVVTHLHDHPETRQAYLPVWFPEDTGVVHGERVPCTLGYHFIMRGGYLHMTYYIRSCDFFRHFRDDLYLSLRLQLWVLNRLRDTESANQGMEDEHQRKTYPNLWRLVKPGLFTFHCVSMHGFLNDFRAWAEKEKEHQSKS